MLTYNIEKGKNTPIYLQIYTHIKNDINSGLIKSNEKLPSKRNLAQHLKISVISVQNAYAQLLSEGYIYSREKSGYFASEIETLNDLQIKKENEHEIKPQDAVEADFIENSINIRNFPFSIWSKQMRDVLNERDDRLLSKMPNNGLENLRNAIASHLYSFRGMKVSPGQIIIGAGTEYLYGLLVKLMGREMVIALEDPGYTRISQIYESENISLVHLDMDADGLNVKSLYESSANTVHISPSHHFPTGITMPIKRRLEILKWANEANDRYIIEDDYDSEYRFVGKSVPTMKSIDENEKVIYINTFSKTITPSIRISYMVLPTNVLTRYKQKLQIYSCTVSSFEQYTLAKFIEKGYFERHINRMRKLYKTQRDLVIKAIKASPLGEISKIYEENSGLHFILSVETSLSDEEIIEKARQNKIKLSCLSQYYYNKQNSKSSNIIINYSGIDIEKIEQTFVILTEIIIGVSRLQIP